MGLKLTLEKEKNHLYHTFENAYWAIKEIRYTTSELYGKLICYPSREASHKQGLRVEEHFDIGGPYFPIFEANLYCWEFLAPISTVFPNGIPISEDEQKTAIYNWVKATTGLPFTDVLEEQETN